MEKALNIYKKILLPQGTIVVDETAVKNIHDKVLYENREILTLLDTDEFCGFEEDGGMGTVRIKYCYKIIPSTFFISKDIPMYKEEDDEDRKIVAAQQYALDKCKDNMSCLTKVKVAWENGFETKAAQSKGCHTDEEVRGLVNSVTEFISHHEPEEFNEWFEKKLQSLKDKPIEFEMEKCKQSDSCSKSLSKKCICPKGLKTTRDESGQLWCYLKK